jgi:hypothetical protein
MKTNDLIGPALDWAVAKAENFPVVIVGTNKFRIWKGTKVPFDPSTNWGDGGPIIDRELCSLVRCQTNDEPEYWEAVAGHEYDHNSVRGYGPTPLIAAMRCFVASKLGEEVDVPKELM